MSDTSTPTTCPTCGSPVIHHASDEGTHSYEPDRSLVVRLAQLVEEQNEREIQAERNELYLVGIEHELRGLLTVAVQYLDTGRGDLDGWIARASDALGLDIYALREEARR